MGLTPSPNRKEAPQNPGRSTDPQDCAPRPTTASTPRSFQLLGQLQLFETLDTVSVPSSLQDLGRQTDSALLDLDKLQYQPGQALVASLYHERNSNFCFIAPTGSGKTYALLQLAAQHLTKGERVIIITPTEVVVNQHAATAASLLKIDPSQILPITGEIAPARRGRIYNQLNPLLIIATPGALLEDLRGGRLSPSDIKAAMLDEVHEILKMSSLKCVGGPPAKTTGLNNTSYRALVELLQQHSIRCAGFTASSGRSDPAHEAALCRALNVGTCIRMPSVENIKSFVHESAPPLEKVEQVLPMLNQDIQRACATYYACLLKLSTEVCALRDRLADPEDPLAHRTGEPTNSSLRSSIANLIHWGGLHRKFFLRIASRGKGDARAFVVPSAGDYISTQKDISARLHDFSALVAKLERTQREQDSEDPALPPISRLRGSLARAHSFLCEVGHLRHAYDRLELFGPFAFLDFTTPYLMKVKGYRSADGAPLIDEAPGRWEKRAYGRTCALTTVHKRISEGSPYAFVHAANNLKALEELCATKFSARTESMKSPAEPYLDHCARWMALHRPWEHPLIERSRSWLLSTRLNGIKLIRCSSVREARFVKAVLATHFRHRHNFSVDAVFGSSNMNPETRDAIMNRARAGDISVIVATSILDLGVNVPQIAMVIDYEIVADPVRRFQLAGRPGRRQSVNELDAPVGLYVTFFAPGRGTIRLRAGMSGYRGIEKRERRFLWKECPTEASSSGPASSLPPQSAP